MCCARAAPGFPNKSPVIRSSSCWNVVRCNRLALPAMSPSSRTSPAIPCRSVPWVRLPAPRTDFGPARLIWFPRRACASTVPADAHSAPTIGGARCYGAWPVTIPRSTRNGTAIRDAGRSPMPNALSLNRFRCPPRCCWTGSDVCYARAAPGFPSKSPVIRSSSCWNVVRCNRLASPAMSPSSRTSPAIPCRSAP
ncbi:Uncharacterised protein [Mycobacteroides abscessus subsp. abscessus]|nr:Uncharacterised protein [Mycobacteroides abscessus subsp. abscessus]